MIDQNKEFDKHKTNGMYTKEQVMAGLVTDNLVYILWRGRWLLLISIIICLLMAFIYITKATPIYQCTSRIYVEQSGPKIIAEMETGVMTKANNYLYTQAELLKSTPIIADALNPARIRQMQTFAKVDNLVAFLKRNLVVDVGRRDDIISVSFNSPYPAEAADLVNAIVDSYITFHSTRKQNTSAEVLKILQTEKAKQSQELSEKLQALTNYSRENEELVFEGRQGNLVMDKLEKLSTALTEAQLKTVEYKSIYESLKEMVSNPDRIKQFVEAHRTAGVSLSSDTEKAELKSRLTELELSRNNLSRQLTPDHPGILAYEKDIENIKNQIAALDIEFVNSQLAVAKQQYLTEKEKEDQIKEYYEQQRQEAIALNEHLTQYTLLQSDWEQTKKLCDILDDRIKELNITEDVGALNISILEVAVPAEKPSEPQKAKYMAIALVLGLMLGGGLVLIRDSVDQKLHSAEEICSVLNLPVLGIVPSMSKRDNITERGRKVYLDSKSPWAEAYRTIRTAVFFGAPKSEARTILVTSPSPSDGKTTLVSNLAIAMAQAGQKTLILDADFRKPMQQNIFRLDHQYMGLTSVLAGEMNIQEAIQSTDIKGLDILTRGPEVPNPSEILNSKGFSKLLELLSERYDRVVIDSPPVTPITDAKIVAAICDITILVLRAEKSTRKISQQAMEGLLSVGAHILGVIVNDVHKKSHYGYYSAYGNYSGYYGNEKNQKREIARKSQVVT
ncbi:MAG: polysaccharide biosynthesis tyrosine autokinase [Sedimentisphaerales bacterium]|nr:polysaccharide biosynthesis tyrosine autokinase [Sedimentisphaerales bacterium]